MNKKKELLKNTIIIFIGKACTQLISFLLLPLYTGYLSTSDYGIVDLITTYVTLLVPIITLELEMSIFRYLVDSRSSSKDSEKLMSNNFYVLGISLLVFSILYLVVTAFWSFPFRFLILLDIIVCVLSGNFLQVARGKGKTLDFSISCIITGVTTIVSNIILIAIFRMGARGMIISMALANFMCSLYLFVKLKMYKEIKFKSVDKPLIKEMFGYSIPLIPNSISWWIINVSDRSIISLVLGASFNGIYAVSNKFPTIISSILGVFNLSWAESSALHINSEDSEKFFSDTINIVIKLFTCLGVGMIACMPFVFPILVNAKYNAAFDQIPLLVLGAVFNVLVCIYSGIYIAKKMTKKVANTAVLGAVFNVVINILLIKKIGLFAASLSTAVAYFAMMIYRYFDLKKYINIKYEKSLLLKTILIFAIAIICYYQKNLYLNVISLVIVVIYSYIMNKDFLISTSREILKKLKR